MNPLGLYFGPKAVGVAQTDAKKITRSFQIPRVLFSEPSAEDKVPDEVKIVALFNDEFRKAGISSNHVSISLSGKDLIIRTFEMPVLPKDELYSAVTFEAKKYIPFKIDELVYDYQLLFDNTVRKNLVLLVGIKKDILAKYLAIFSQLSMSVSSIEYSAFTVLRLIKNAGVALNGITAIVSSDFTGQDEINFIVLQNGFPLFSRDIIISDEIEPHLAASDSTSGNILEKLKGELRVSMDFYKRKFPSKNIDRVFFVAPDEFRADLEAFLKERGVTSRFIDVRKQIGALTPFSLSLAKAFGAAVSKLVKIPIKIDLLTAKKRVKPGKLTGEDSFKSKGAELLQGIRFDPRIIFLGILLCVIPFGIGLFQRFPIQQQIDELIRARPPVTAVGVNESYEMISAVNGQFKDKINEFATMLNKQHFLTEQLNDLPGLIPDGVWVNDFRFSRDPRSDKKSLIFSGNVYLKDGVKELKAVNEFLANIKADSGFSKAFKSISISTVDQKIIEDFSVTSFTIICTN